MDLSAVPPGPLAGCEHHVKLLRINEAESRLGLWIRTATPRPVVGRVIGPNCAYTRTVPASYPLRPIEESRQASSWSTWIADIPESCLWEPEHPFRYELCWSIGRGLPEMRVFVGLRRLSVRAGGLLLNARKLFVRGVWQASVTEPMLRTYHEWGCSLVHGGHDASATDSLGPLLACRLPDDVAAASALVRSLEATRPAIGVWLKPGGWTGPELEQLKRLAPTVVFGAMAPADTSAPPVAADLCLFVGSTSDILKAASNTSAVWLAQATDVASKPDSAESWAALVRELDDRFKAVDRCAGWIA